MNRRTATLSACVISGWAAHALSQASEPEPPAASSAPSAQPSAVADGRGDPPTPRQPVRSFSHVPEEPFTPATTPASPETVLGVYQRGMVSGGRPGFVLRFGTALSYGTMDLAGTGASAQVFDPLNATLGLGGRHRVSPRAALTLEAELALSAMTLFRVSGFDEPEPPAQDPDQTSAPSANGTAFSPVTLAVGLAPSAEFAASDAVGLYFRPSVLWHYGFTLVQPGNSSAPVPEPDGVLHERSYEGLSYGAQGGFMFYMLRRHFQLGLGVRSVTYSVSGVGELSGTTFALTFGTTS